ncbi:hypothetical protein niasHT_021777 [Heterodera trifolii]|uniref:Gag protein n=1 Tax=Heterodera trifolii TaxID=157864 RepID=A0ABD2J8I2_9BILA
MSSARCRMALGPALFRLRQHVTTAENLLDEPVINAETTENLEQERAHITRILSRMEVELDAWGAIMNGLQGPAREAEEALFTAFVRDDRHLTEWLEDAREMLAHIAAELADEPNQPIAAGGQQPAVAVNPPVPAVPFVNNAVFLGGANAQQPAAVANAANQPPPMPINAGGVHGQQPFAVANPANLALPVPINAAPVPLATARLPQLSLPVFSGEPMEWPAFWQSFESAVDRAALEPVDKLNYLHGCLRGKAARAVTAYRGGENYAHAVAALRRLFGDPRKIAEALQSELINLRPVDDSVGSLQHFLETLERVCRQLSNLNMPDDRQPIHVPNHPQQIAVHYSVRTRQNGTCGRHSMGYSSAQSWTRRSSRSQRRGRTVPARNKCRQTNTISARSEAKSTSATRTARKCASFLRCSVRQKFWQKTCSVLPVLPRPALGLRVQQSYRCRDSKTLPFAAEPVPQLPTEGSSIERVPVEASVPSVQRTASFFNLP